MGSWEGGDPRANGLMQWLIGSSVLSRETARVVTGIWKVRTGYRSLDIHADSRVLGSTRLLVYSKATSRAKLIMRVL